MTKEKGNDPFQLPGGGQNKGESHEDILRREVKEELGVEIKDPQIYDDFILPGRNENIKIRFLIYTAEVLGEANPGEEIDEIALIDSSYKEKSIDIGNPTKLRLVPRLLKESLID